MPAPVTEPIAGAVSGLDDGLALVLDFLTGGGVLDPRITFTRASSAWYYDSTGTLVAAGNNVARFDYDPATLAPRGLLVEEQRTNNVRNSGMSGGSAGVAPTNWAITTTGSGLTSTIVGVFTVQGMATLRVRFNGTTLTGTPKVSVAFDSPTPTMSGLAAGTVMAISAVLARQAGTWTGVTSAAFTLQRENGVGTILDTITSNLAALPTTGYVRYAATPTLNDIGSSPYRLGLPSVVFNLAATTAVDFTVDIAVPQLETGSIETSPIVTTGTAATRARDLPTMSATGWYNPTKMGTFVAEFMWTQAGTPSSHARVFTISDGTTTEMLILVRFSTTPTVVTPHANVGGIGVLAAAVGSTVTMGAVHRQAVSVAPTGVWRDAANGVQANQINGSPLSAGVNNLTLGAVAGGGQYMNGYIRKLLYFAKPMLRDELAKRTQ